MIQGPNTHLLLMAEAAQLHAAMAGIVTLRYEDLADESADLSPQIEQVGVHHNHRCSLVSLPSVGVLQSLLSGSNQGKARRRLDRWAWAYWRWRACRGMRRCARACCSWPSAWW